MKGKIHFLLPKLFFHAPRGHCNRKLTTKDSMLQKKMSNLRHRAVKQTKPANRKKTHTHTNPDQMQVMKTSAVHQLDMWERDSFQFSIGITRLHVLSFNSLLKALQKVSTNTLWQHPVLIHSDSRSCFSAFCFVLALLYFEVRDQAKWELKQNSVTTTLS